MHKTTLTLLLTGLSTNICCAQTTVSEDFITLNTGEKYLGQIIEQRPGSSVRFVANDSKDTLVFYLTQIASIKKQNKTVKKAPEAPQEAKQPTIDYEQNGTPQTGNDLTIFSEDEYKFRVYINGKPFNQNFATRVAIENINHNWARISVLFEDSEMGVIEQDVPLSGNDAEMLPYTSTYKVLTHKGRLKLRYANCSLKKVAPGAANVLIHRNTAPSNINFGIYHHNHHNH